MAQKNSTSTSNVSNEVEENTVEINPSDTYAEVSIEELNTIDLEALEEADRGSIGYRVRALEETVDDLGLKIRLLIDKIV